MKFIFCAVLLFVGAVAAQQTNDGTGRALAESLQKRGEALVAATQKRLTVFGFTHQTHLTAAIEHQLALVEALVLDLKTQLANAAQQHQHHHLHVIEEELLHLENTIADELWVVEETQLHHQHHGQTHDELVVRGENLIKTANEALGHHADLPEAKQIQREVAVVKEIIKKLQTQPNAVDLASTEQQLARHEKSLQVLLEKAANRGH